MTVTVQRLLRAFVAVLFVLAAWAPTAGAQTAGAIALEASPRECVAAGVGQGLTFDQALRACMIETSGGRGDPIGELIGPDAASEPGQAGAVTCGTSANPYAGGSADGGYETVVRGHRDPPVRTLTDEERAILREAALTFPWRNPVAGWTDQDMGDVWDTAAKVAKEHAAATGTKADKQRAERLRIFSALVLAARAGTLEKGPWTKDQVKGMAKLIADGPTWEMVKGASKFPGGGSQCALTAAAVEQLKACDAHGWATPDCQRLQHCPSSEVTDPVPEGEITCGDPDVDTDALEDAAWAKCHESIHPAPGADPCAGWQGALVIVQGSGAADACHDPAAQPLQDGCVKISLAPPGTVNLVQVLSTGLDRLGGPVIVLPDDGPPNPHA